MSAVDPFVFRAFRLFPRVFSAVRLWRRSFVGDLSAVGEAGGYFRVAVVVFAVASMGLLTSPSAGADGRMSAPQPQGGDRRGPRIGDTIAPLAVFPGDAAPPAFASEAARRFGATLLNDLIRGGGGGGKDDKGKGDDKPHPSDSAPFAVGKPVGRFELPLLTDMLAGNAGGSRFGPETHMGEGAAEPAKFVLAALWYAKDPGSRFLLARLHKLAKKYGDKGLAVVAVTVGKAPDDFAQAKAFTDGAAFRVLADPDLRVAKRYAVDGKVAVPSLVEIDPGAVVGDLHQGVSPISVVGLEERVVMMLGVPLIPDPPAPPTDDERKDDPKKDGRGEADDGGK